MLTASIFDTSWHATLAAGVGPVFLLSEAVLLYFPAERVHDWLRTIAAAR